MTGNLWEWTTSSGGGGTYTLCGGSWYDDGNFCNISRRDYSLPDFSLFGIGFRVCR
jgi:formylglycine-generating enzyme required for sulfatase activity